MNSWPEWFKPFLSGGQAEIYDKKDEFIYRGEIKTLTLDDVKLEIEFVWVAKRRKDQEPKAWLVAEIKDYHADLSRCLVNNLGPERDYIIAASRIGGDKHLVLFPPGINRLEPEEVGGLSLA